MPDLPTVLKQLNALAKPENLEGMAHFAIIGENRLGISIPKLRKLAKETGKDHTLALELWRTNIPEARILREFIANDAYAKSNDGFKSYYSRGQ